MPHQAPVTFDYADMDDKGLITVHHYSFQFKKGLPEVVTHWYFTADSLENREGT